MRDKSVVRLSVTPSTKYSCSGSSPMLANGSTTMDRRGAAVGRGQLDEHSRAQANRIRADRTGDVLEGLLAKISEIDRDLATDPDRRRLSYPLKARRDVHAIAENVLIL